jgi:drug/metabolite transporter (DMT)-like permease
VNKPSLHTKQTHYTAMFQAHMAVFLFALAGLFGKWLVIPAVIITLGRASFASMSLGIYHYCRYQQLPMINKSQQTIFLISGCLLAIHWTSFFLAIQLSTVSIALLSFATFPLFTAIAEPLLQRKPPRLFTLFQTVIVAFALWLIVPKNHWQNSYLSGVLVGLLSAITFTALILCNKQLIQRQTAQTIAFYQNSIASLLLLPVLFFIDVNINIEQLGLLILLGVVFTAIAHSLLNHSLHKLSAYQTSLAVMLEPFYAIVAAALLINEPLNWPIIIGGLIIIVMNLWSGLKQSLAD